LGEEWYKKYEEIGMEEWPSDFSTWKTMFLGFLAVAKPNPPDPFTEMLLDMFVDVARARMEGTRIIMHPFNYGPEIFYAMNLQPLMQEVFSVGLAPFHMNEPYIDITNQIGFGDNPTICNAQRPLIGACTSGEVPNPDLLFYLSAPCNSLATTYQVYQSMAGIPTFNVDIPYWDYDPTLEFYDEKTMGYVISQLKDLISWLEKETKQKFDVERFKQTMIWLNQARENVMEHNDLLKAVPSPVNSLESWRNYLIMVLRGGTPDAVKLTKWTRDYAAANVKKGIGGVPDEKIRIAWPYTHVFFDQDLFPWLEENFHAVTIMDMLGYYYVRSHDTSTIDKCFESLAIGTLDFSMIGTCRGPAEYYIDYLLRFVKDYKVDCVIMPIQFACKHVYAIARLASEAVRQEIGIPVLITGCDPYDSREVPSETIRGRIAEFLTQIVM